MAFIEEQLLRRVRYGFTGGGSFSTTKVPLYSGKVARNAERAQPKYRFSAPYSELKTTEQEQIIAAHMACLGGVHSFRFKDWNDYSAELQSLGDAIGGVDEAMQLVKTYWFGTQSLSRTIKKPVSGSVQLYEDGVPLASVVDTTTGIVTFTASTPGKEITWTGEFDVPVYFEDDILEFTIVNKKSHSAEVVLVEDLFA